MEMNGEIDILRLKRWTNDDLTLFKSLLESKYSDVEVRDIYPNPKTVGRKTHFKSFYIQIWPKKLPANFHFEYSADGWEGILEFHLEPDNNNPGERKRYQEIGIKLENILTDKGYKKDAWWGIPNGAFKKGGINDLNGFVQVFDSFYYDIYEPLLEIYEAKKGTASLKLYYPEKPIDYEPLRKEDEEVSVRVMNLREVMGLKLILPPYQREYCWEDKNITDLWKNLKKVEDGSPYHLGTIIFHDYNRSFGVIDGQQRLITLSIILLALGYDGYLPLLNESYDSTDAQQHIANCKYIVQKLVEKEKNPPALAKRLADNISFAVLTVNEANFDLAYTFFSNQNSKGVALSDFDLLKAHHLRFIYNEEQAEHMATKWNKLNSLEPVYNERNALYRTLGTHIYRMRRWMRKNESYEGSEHYIQHEYQTAATMADIPPFGEKFDFYEKIQGGTHFFVYAETFSVRYLEFLNCSVPILEILQRNLAWGRYERYSDSIETILFAYYLKFGQHYLAEALYCIAHLTALYRYNTSRDAGDGTSFRRFMSESELMLMLDQASSPTFFLAEAISMQEDLPHNRNLFPRIINPDDFICSGMDLPEEGGIRHGMYSALQRMFRELLPYVSEKTILNLIIEEYGE